MGSSHDDPQSSRRDGDDRYAEDRRVEDLDEPALEAPLLGGLAELYPGFELLDSDLEFERPHRVQYVGLDGAGRLTLVLRVRGEGHSALLRALDARDFARRHLTPLLAHVAARRARPELPPRVVLIAADYEERLRRRLANLVECGIEAFELRRLRSRSGELVFLAPVAAAPSAPPQPASSLADFLETLPKERRDDVEALMARLERLDQGLAVERRAKGLAWRLGDDVLAELAFDGEGAAELFVTGKSRRPWLSGSDADDFLEEAVRGYLERAGHAPDAPADRRAVPDLAQVATLAAPPARTERARAEGALEADMFGD